MATRPAGVTLIAVIVWINGLLSIIGGIVALVSGGSAALPAAIVSIIIGILTIAVGVGLLRGSRVARVIATIFLVLSLASAIYSIVVGIAAPGSIIVPIISGVLALVALIMLWSSRASSFFRS
jgi:LytS/YehU family sensor histidine kinase